VRNGSALGFVTCVYFGAYAKKPCFVPRILVDIKPMLRFSVEATPRSWLGSCDHSIHRAAF